MDVVHGVAELAAYGALPAALADTADRSRRLAALEARSATVAAVVGGAAALIPAVVAVWIAVLADGRSGPVLALVALSVGEVVVPLAAAAVRHAELRGGLRRVRELIATAAPVPAAQDRAAQDRAAQDRAVSDGAAGGSSARSPRWTPADPGSGRSVDPSTWCCGGSPCGTATICRPRCWTWTSHCPRGAGWPSSDPADPASRRSSR